MESTLLHHGPCDACGSKDNNAVYDDGHSYCFGCEKHVAGDGETRGAVAVVKKRSDLLNVRHVSLNKRRLTTKSLRHWSYGEADFKGGVVQCAQWIDSTGAVVAQKLRLPGKKFAILGDAKAMNLYGEWLWPPGGRNLVITEGELDAISVSQTQDLKWPVVSLPNGAASAVKAIKKSLEYVESFKRVVLMFDADEAGQKAAIEVAQLLTPGKAHIAKWPTGIKDASDAMQAGKTQVIEQAFWRAPAYRPDGIMDVRAVESKMRETSALQPIGKPFTPALFAKMRYLVSGQIIMVCAGSGMGKTEFAREFSYSLLQQGLVGGYVGLEEGVERSLVGFAGLHISERLDLWEERDSNGMFKAPYQHPKWDDAMAYFEDKLFVYDDWGSVESSNLLAKIRYLRVGLGCDFIVLDHLSILVSDLEEDDERKTIDKIMTRLRSLSEETGAVIICISHLKRPQGTPHEEGGKTSLSQLRGSASIGQISDVCIGLERDQQSDDGNANTTTVRILKNRRTGRVGIAGQLDYDSKTGRMLPVIDSLESADVIRGDDFQPTTTLAKPDF